jgi:hypothetical protein
MGLDTMTDRLTDRQSERDFHLSGHESQGAWRQDELIGDKPLVVK